MAERILFAAPGIFHSPPADMIYEVVEDRLLAGDRVDFVHCGAKIPACEMNPERKLRLCVDCMDRHSAYRKLLSDKMRLLRLPNLAEEDRRKIAALPKEFANLEELMGYEVDNFDVGAAAVSSLVSHLRDPDPDLAEHREMVHRMLQAGLAFYFSLINWLRETPYEHVYSWNGRHLLSRAALRAVQSAGSRISFIEYGHDYQHYAVYPDDMHHKVSYREKQIREAWEKAADDPAQRENIARAFYENRAKGAADYIPSYTANQAKGRLPRGWDSRKTNVVIFNSSEDEYVAIGEELKNPIYRNQADGLLRIVESLRGRDHNLHLTLRIHPNLSGLHYAQLENVRRLEADYLTVIQPEENVSSYDLLFAADKVLTFGSSMGIEAVYWEKPSILAGMCYYSHLGGTHNPKTHEELLEMLLKKIAPKPVEPALIYAYYFATFGRPFRHYEPRDLQGGLFKGARPIGSVRYDFLHFLLAASQKHSLLDKARKHFKKSTIRQLRRA